MKKGLKWIFYLFVALIALMAVGGLAKQNPEAAVGIGACIAAVFVGSGWRRLLGRRKGMDTQTAASVVMGQVMANNPLGGGTGGDADGGMDSD